MMWLGIWRSKCRITQLWMLIHARHDCRLRMILHHYNSIIIIIQLYNNFMPIDQAYIYGVSLSHGRNPHEHIWTLIFTGAADETSQQPNYISALALISTSSSTIRIPSFIGNDYFCDASLSNYFSSYSKSFYPNDPLWDGNGCGTSNTCCSVSNLYTKSPPWFIKHLSSSTTDNNYYRDEIV